MLTLTRGRGRLYHCIQTDLILSQGSLQGPLLLPQEFSAFMRVETKSELVVDRSRHGELLRINFNMSFPQLSCEFATVDVSDALGTVRQPQR